MILRKHRVIVAAVVCLFLTANSQAAFDGSTSLGSIGNNVSSGVNLANMDVFSVNIPFANAGTGDFSVVPNLTRLNPDPLTIDFNDLGDLTLSAEDWGTFMANEGTIISRSAGLAEVLLTGRYDNSAAMGRGFAFSTLTTGGGDPAIA